jgi:hypothetical protein
MAGSPATESRTGCRRRPPTFPGKIRLVEDAKVIGGNMRKNSKIAVLQLLVFFFGLSLGAFAQSIPDILTEKPFGTKQSYKNEYAYLGSGATTDVLPTVTGSGYVDHIYIAAVSSFEVKIYVDGETNPSSDITNLLDLCGDHYVDTQPSFAGRWIIGGNAGVQGVGSCGLILPVPFKSSVHITVTNHASAMIGPWFSTVTYNLGVTDNYSYTQKLFIVSGAASGVSPNSVVSLLNVTPNKRGRLAGIAWLYDGYPGGVSPATGPLEGNFRIFLDGTANPNYESSGSEDFFDMEYYFHGFGTESVWNGYTFNTGFNQSGGNIGMTVKTNQNPPFTFGAYRFFIDDPIVFQNALKIDWACGNTSQANFTGKCTVFWTVYYYTED